MDNNNSTLLRKTFRRAASLTESGMGLGNVCPSGRRPTKAVVLAVVNGANKSWGLVHQAIKRRRRARKRSHRPVRSLPRRVLVPMRGCGMLRNKSIRAGCDNAVGWNLTRAESRDNRASPISSAKRQPRVLLIHSCHTASVTLKLRTYFVLASQSPVRNRCSNRLHSKTVWAA